MKKLALSLLLASCFGSTVVVVACNPPPSEGEGEGREGEGEEGEGEEGEGEGEEGEGEGEGLATPCVADTDCADDESCQTLVNGADKFCFNSCVGGQACTTNLNRPGSCIRVAQDGPDFCAELSDSLGPCGNAINASCDIGGGAPGVCLTAPESPVGFCARLCNPNDPGTCSDPDGLGPANACGCDAATEACSQDVTLESGDGVCAPPTDVGDTCGANQAELTVTLCTGDTRCNGATCDAAAEGEGEGEGEGE